MGFITFKNVRQILSLAGRILRSNDDGLQMIELRFSKLFRTFSLILLIFVKGDKSKLGSNSKESNRYVEGFV